MAANLLGCVLGQLMAISASSILSLPLSSFKQRLELDLPLPVLKVISFDSPEKMSGQSSEIVDSLEPVMRSLDTRVMWFATANDQESLEHDLSFSFYPLKIQPGLLNTCANFLSEYLFPLFQGLPSTKPFDTNEWKSLRQLNELVAGSVLAVSSDSFPILFWLHDYQLALAAPLLSMQAGTILAHYWQSPWPAPKMLLHSPIIEDIVQAMLSNDVIAFQSEKYAANFLKTVEAIAPKANINKHLKEIRYEQHLTKVKVMPLGIDWLRWQALSNSSQSTVKNLRAEYQQDEQLILSIDRLISSRGVLEKLAAINQFLKDNDGQATCFRYIQVLYDLPRSNQPDNQTAASYYDSIKAEITRINEQYGKKNWQPISLIEGRLSPEELAAWYQSADILMINPLTEGVTLMGKEFIACRQDEQGILILSKKCGSADELANGALLVDPTNVAELTQAISKSLAMKKEDRKNRMSQLRQTVSGNQLQDWAIELLRHALSTTSYR